MNRNYKIIIKTCVLSIIGAVAGNIFAATLTIGDVYQGGTIFWLDETNEHGLIAARSDHSRDEAWSETETLINAFGDGVYSGNLNTIAAIEKLRESNARFAALAVKEYIVAADGTACDDSDSTNECYGDWYLPSKFELDLMHQQKLVIGGFSHSPYWSSTEIDAGNAWTQYFGDGGQTTHHKINQFKVRLIRAF